MTTSVPESRQQQDRLLFRFMLLSLAAAVVTIVLKASAAWATGSVGFLSDALESGVNLVAAVVALIALRVAARPPDASHHFGHGKAEYVSALVEGAMIFVAATAIIWTAIERLISPVPLVQPGLGLALSTVASVINLGVGLTLLRVGRTHRSITLVADGKHLLTDVWTSAGVIVGIALVAVTGWEPLDPIVALAVGVNILWTGYRLLRGSVSGLLSAALPPARTGPGQRRTGRVPCRVPRRVRAAAYRRIRAATSGVRRRDRARGLDRADRSRHGRPHRGGDRRGAAAHRDLHPRGTGNRRPGQCLTQGRRCSDRCRRLTLPHSPCSRDTPRAHPSRSSEFHCRPECLVTTQK